MRVVDKVERAEWRRTDDAWVLRIETRQGRVFAAHQEPAPVKERGSIFWWVMLAVFFLTVWGMS